MNLAKAYSLERVDEAAAQAHYASILLAAGRFEEAEVVLLAALRLDKNTYLALFYIVWLFAKSGRVEEAQRYADRLGGLLDADTFEFALQLINKKIEL